MGKVVEWMLYFEAEKKTPEKVENTGKSQAILTTDTFLGVVVKIGFIWFGISSVKSVPAQR